MPSVLPFAPRDLALLERRPFTDLELVFDGRDPHRAGRDFAEAGPAFTIWDDARDYPLLCGGAQVHHEGYATVWAAWARGAEAHKLYITKRTANFVGSLRYGRVDAMVGEDNPGAVGWCRLLGFTEEGRMRGVFPGGGDAVVMARFREE